jgi:hypothetical protein
MPVFVQHSLALGAGLRRDELVSGCRIRVSGSVFAVVQHEASSIRHRGARLGSRVPQESQVNDTILGSCFVRGDGLPTSCASTSTPLPSTRLLTSLKLRRASRAGSTGRRTTKDRSKEKLGNPGIAKLWPRPEVDVFGHRQPQQEMPSGIWATSTRPSRRLDVGITAVILSDVKTAISIPDALFESADRVAEHLGISRSELYQRAIERYLRDHSQRVVTERLNKVYEAEATIGSLDSVLERLQALSLTEDEW